MKLNETVGLYCATRQKESYQSWARRLERRLVGLVSRYDRGKIPLSQFGTAFKDTLDDAFETAYKFGLDSAGASDVIPKRDQSYLGSLSKKQKKYVDGFLKDLKKGTSRTDIYERAKLYTGAVDEAFWTGNVRGQPPDTIYQWVLFPADHCEDCEDLANGGPYTPRTLPTVPRAGATRCKMNCKCKLIVVRRGKKKSKRAA